MDSFAGSSSRSEEDPRSSGFGNPLTSNPLLRSDNPGAGRDSTPEARHQGGSSARGQGSQRHGRGKRGGSRYYGEKNKIKLDRDDDTPLKKSRYSKWPP